VLLRPGMLVEMRITPAVAARADMGPTWPPLLATRGQGAASAPHAHHAMHVVLGIDALLRVRAGAARWTKAAGVLTAPDVIHQIDAEGTEILLVFIDPESDVGEALRPALRGPVRAIDAAERDALLAAPAADPRVLMTTGGIDWTRRVVATLGGELPASRPPVHPRVRKLLRHLRTLPADADTSLPALAAAVDLSPGRLMHAFTASIGLPVRPYLAWLRLQRAAAAIAGGAPLARAAVDAGFADAAHMSRTFRRMLGMAPSMLRPRGR